MKPITDEEPTKGRIEVFGTLHDGGGVAKASYNNIVTIDYVKK